MKIVKVETLDLRVPLDRVRSDSVNLTDAWGFATVRLHTDTGLVGTGYTGVARGLGNSLILQAVREFYVPILMGRDPMDHAALWQELYWCPLHWCGRSGVSHMALAAVDIALWDLHAQAAELPLCDLLGALPADTFPAYNTNGGWLSFTVDELIDNVKESVDAGFSAVKLKVGSPFPRDDLKRIEAVRAAAGPDIGLMVDANQAWRLDQAQDVGRHLADFDILWLEEPLDPDNWRAHKRLAASIATPIALGEHVYSLNAFSDFILGEAVEYVQADATRVGGVTEFLRVADLAAAHELPLCPHAGDMMQVHQHLVFAAESARWFEHIPWGSDLFEVPAVVRDGFLSRPSTVGAGTAMRDDAVDRYLVERREVTA